MVSSWKRRVDALKCNSVKIWRKPPEPKARRPEFFKELRASGFGGFGDSLEVFGQLSLQVFQLLKEVVLGDLP